jgi:hypothetical protein
MKDKDREIADKYVFPLARLRFQHFVRTKKAQYLIHDENFSTPFIYDKT